MDIGSFYFLSDEYYKRFPNCGLMWNKGEHAGRPCFYAVKDWEEDGIYWMVPISSRIEKYKRIYECKKDGYLGLEFGYVLGKKAAFLLQNICPVTEEYVLEKYITKDGHVVSVPPKKRKEINRKAVKLIALTKKGKRCTLSDALYVYEELTGKQKKKELKFGTGGLRGKLGDGPDKMNINTVTKATQGLADYIHGFGNEAVKKGVVIAYDCRRMSTEFAEATALCLNANGIQTFLFDSLRPTPELSYAVRFLKCIAGVVITASHNPPEYNGYKVYWEDGAQIVSPHDKGIMGYIGMSEVRSMSRDEAEAAKLFHIIGKEIDEAYYEDVIRQSIHPDVVSRMAPLVKVVYSPLHGTGCVPVQEILRRIGFTSVYVVEEQAVVDGEFPTCESPNPENPAAFKLALELACEVDADIVMATDPDADRLGVYVKDSNRALAGTFFSEDEAYPYVRFNGNMSGTLMAEYVCREKSALGTLPKDGVVVSTIVSSNLCRRIAEEYGLLYMETLTGFKYVGEKIHEFELSGEHHFVYGMEESFGCLVGDYTRDKDACGAVVMMCEMAAFNLEKGKTLCDALKDMYEKYGWYTEGQKSVKYDKEDGASEMAAVVEGYRREPPIDIDGRKTVAVRDYMVGTRRVASKEGNEGGVIEQLDLPKSNVIYFELEDDAWMAVRPSGTEPKVKYYWGARYEDLKNDSGWSNIELRGE